MTYDELTPRERDVFELARRGLSNEAIALYLGISRNAVRFHLKELHSKLETGSDRSRLAGWRRLRGWLPGLSVPISAGTAKVAVGAAMGTFAIAGAAAAFTFADNGGSGNTGQVVAVDGRYPNGCSEAISAWQTTTLEGFAAEYHDHLGTYDELAELNPELVGEQLPAGTEVLIAYNPNNTCGEAQATPVDAMPESGGTPQADDFGSAADALLTPEGASPEAGGTPEN